MHIIICSPFTLKFVRIKPKSFHPIKGDGGGPLICALNGGKENKKKYVQVGIVSWGIGCGDENVPGVYSSLQANIQWINKHLKILAQ